MPGWQITLITATAVLLAAALALAVYRMRSRQGRPRPAAMIQLPKQPGLAPQPCQEAAMIRCPSGHWFNGPIESLTWERAGKHIPGAPAVASTASPPGLTGSHDGRHGTGGSLIHDPGRPGQAIRRPNSAPAYYLGRPASFWITALSPRRTGPASTHLKQAITSS
jgi:hypothetical protein